jgi:hypothetical protein
MIGNCIFVYGTVKSYVVHAMWIAIMTLILSSAGYYLGVFHRHIQAGSTHRLASILRTVIAARSSLQAAVSCRNSQAESGDVSHVESAKTSRNTKKLDKAIRNSLSRSRVLILITALFVACWYPLYLLTLFDPKFEQPSKLYKVLTFIAWSNATINPLVFLLFDRNIGSFKRISCTMSQDPGAAATSSRRHMLRLGVRRATGEGLTRRLSSSVGGGSIYERVGCRLYSEGQYQLQTTSVRRTDDEEQINGTGLQQSSMRDLSVSDFRRDVIVS